MQKKLTMCLYQKFVAKALEEQKDELVAKIQEKEKELESVKDHFNSGEQDKNQKFDALEGKIEQLSKTHMLQVNEVETLTEQNTKLRGMLEQKDSAIKRLSVSLKRISIKEEQKAAYVKSVKMQKALQMALLRRFQSLIKTIQLVQMHQLQKSKDQHDLKVGVTF